MVPILGCPLGEGHCGYMENALHMRVEYESLGHSRTLLIILGLNVKVHLYIIDCRKTSPTPKHPLTPL